MDVNNVASLINQGESSTLANEMRFISLPFLPLTCQGKVEMSPFQQSRDVTYV